jgi:hypothetical protein
MCGEQIVCLIGEVIQHWLATTYFFTQKLPNIANQCRLLLLPFAGILV